MLEDYQFLRVCGVSNPPFDVDLLDSKALRRANVELLAKAEIIADMVGCTRVDVIRAARELYARSLASKTLVHLTPFDSDEILALLER